MAIIASSEFHRFPHWDNKLPQGHNGVMAPKQPFYLREWRKFRGYTMERLAEMIGTSQGHLSDLEKGKKRYNQDHLEALAIALQCSPADLLMRDPSKPQPIYSLWDDVPEANRDQALAVLSTFTRKTGTNG